MGDSNEVTDPTKHFGSIFNERLAYLFNYFTLDVELNDVLLDRFSFTWMDKWDSKMINMDRFLVFDGMYDKFHSLTGVVLEKSTLGHRPILLKESIVDYI